jgi:hypothetical protein
MLSLDAAAVPELSDADLCAFATTVAGAGIGDVLARTAFATSMVLPVDAASLPELSGTVSGASERMAAVVGRAVAAGPGIGDVLAWNKSMMSSQEGDRTARSAAAAGIVRASGTSVDSAAAPLDG